MDDISLVMVVRNEAHRLEETVKLVREVVDEVCIVVQSSTDGTEVLAQSLADQFMYDTQYGYCELSRKKALDLATCPWVLILDADERVTDFFKEEMSVIQESPLNYAGAWLPTRSITGSQKLVRTDMPHYRFSRRDCIYVSTQLHGDISPTREPSYRCQGICLLNVKSWKEQFEDEVRYEQHILQATYLNDQDRKNNLDVLMTLNAVKAGHTLRQIDQMTIEELEAIGIK